MLTGQGVLDVRCGVGGRHAQCDEFRLDVRIRNVLDTIGQALKVEREPRYRWNTVFSMTERSEWLYALAHLVLYVLGDQYPSVAAIS